MLSLSGAPKLEMSDYVTDSHSSGETHFVDKIFQMGKNKLVQMFKRCIGCCSYIYSFTKLPYSAKKFPTLAISMCCFLLILHI